jgi:hypothetical protein
MGWNNVDDKHKKEMDKFYVSCEEDYEVNYLVKIIKEEYPYIAELDIRKAITSCCLQIKAPRKREEFMICLKNKLGVT